MPETKPTAADRERCRLIGRRSGDAGEPSDACPLHWDPRSREAWFVGWCQSIEATADSGD